ncbi:UDP-glycosyltransferase UGT5-like [Teleopsis dalmanni]|uniref:UDP-glycosyltransferase UGT5-like n=1 Tax=Teleopsis dalmanni TaxID=139649 RepID=UPI0018CCAFBE|nr:UDP-glycosyltransferase UGT5-like [Teleopsis dalmanni]
MKNKNFLAFCVLLIFATPFVSSLNVLGVLNFAARSHHIVGSSLMKALARKGHNVTVISPFPLKEPMANYHDINVPSILKIMSDDINNLFATQNRSIVENILSYHDMGIRVTQATLEEPGVKELIRNKPKFDVVINEVFLSEALFGLSEYFDAPLIGLGTFGAILWNTDMVGSPSPPSYVPSPMLRFSDRMNLLERIGNLAYHTFDRIFSDYFYLPRQEALYKKYFPHNKRSMYEVRKNAAAVLLNQHVSLSFPRPYMPNQIEVGGMHINRKRKPLPAEIQKFIEEAEHGVVYFSMGSNLKSKHLPLEKRQQILQTFRGLKQRVLWKFEDPYLPDKPDNVFISDWFPQDDILAHKNVRAFITHGGLLSTTESIYHGKPFVGIPIFGDQFLNMARAEKNGYGIMLDYQKLDAATFKSAIERIVDEPSYTKLVHDMSARYRDQPMLPIDLAVFWVEHVARHNGAKYLHCAGLDLGFLQYHNIDAMIILYGGILLVFVLIVSLIRFLLNSICNIFVKKNTKSKKVKRN